MDFHQLQYFVAIAESGSIAVDGVATATITSDAIKEAAAAALTAAGLNADDYKTAVEAENTKAEDSTIDADVAIVGAGGAGMTAAITAAGEGKSVVILESQPMVGGNSVRATGGMNAGTSTTATCSVWTGLESPWTLTWRWTADKGWKCTGISGPLEGAYTVLGDEAPEEDKDDEK